jgi:hypothetical protein
MINANSPLRMGIYLGEKSPHANSMNMYVKSIKPEGFSKERFCV